MELMEKQGFKQTEIDFIPSDWKSEVVDKDIAVSRGGSPRPIQDYITKFANGVNWIKIGDTSAKSKYIISSEEKIIPEGVQHSRKVNIGDFILSNSMSFGRPYILRIDGCIHDGWLVLQDYQDAYDTEFLYYILMSKYVYDQYIMKASGSSVLNLNKEIVKTVKLIKPPIKEQKAIATALSDVDVLITNLDKLITKKKAIKQGAMQALLNGKIRLQNFGEAKAMKDSELGLIPEDWDVKLLPEVFDYIHGKAHEQHIDSSGRFTVVNSKFISTEGKVTKNSKENFCPARKGDILTVLSDLPNGKALAKTYYVNTDNKYAVNQRICIWRSKKDSPLFLSFIMNRHKYFMKFDDGVTQTHILNHHIEKCPVLVPRDLNEQTAIAQILSDMDTEITQLETKKEKYQGIKQGMMQELLMGKTRLI